MNVLKNGSARPPPSPSRGNGGVNYDVWHWSHLSYVTNFKDVNHFPICRKTLMRKWIIKNTNYCKDLCVTCEKKKENIIFLTECYSISYSLSRSSKWPRFDKISHQLSCYFQIIRVSGKILSYLLLRKGIFFF